MGSVLSLALCVANDGVGECEWLVSGGADGCLRLWKNAFSLKSRPREVAIVNLREYVDDVAIGVNVLKQSTPMSIIVALI